MADRHGANLGGGESVKGEAGVRAPLLLRGGGDRLEGTEGEESQIKATQT